MSQAEKAFAADIQLRMLLAHRRRHPEDVRLEPMPPEGCRSISPPRADGKGEQYCTLLYGHEGPCSWRRK